MFTQSSNNQSARKERMGGDNLKPYSNLKTNELMKIKENVTVYECEFCRKKMFSKGHMTRHEKQFCKSNPANQDACIGCIHCKIIDREYESIDADEWGHTYPVRTRGFNCAKLNKEMYPFKAVKYAKKYPHTFNGQERMPTECEHFRMY